MGDLGDLLVGMTPEHLRSFVADLEDPDDVDLIERVWAERTSTGWRADPAAMAHYLTGGTWRLWPYVRLLSESFAGAFRGVDPHQIWNLPSQYGKTSELVWGAVWALDRDPSARIMYVSYDADKAVEEGGTARDLAETYQSQLRFELRPDKRARGLWRTTEGGGLYCVGVNGAITGFAADVLLLDDLVKGWQAAHSEAQRKLVWNVYTSQARMRVQGSHCPIIVAGTRWHQDDPAGRLKKAEGTSELADRWKVIRLPAIAETPQPDSPDPMLREPDPLGREPGQVLEPNRFPAEEVYARQAVLGNYLWSAMEQQRPAPEEGGEIMRGWWKWADVPIAQADDWLSSWDMKLKDKEAGDYVVGQVWGRTGSDFWMIDQFRGQWSQAVTKVAIALCQVRHPLVGRHIIENTGYGPEVIEQLRMPAEGYTLSETVASALGITLDERPLVEAVIRRGMTGLLPNNPKGDKSVRLRAVSPVIEAGHVHLVVGSGAEVLVDEAAAFPNGTYDDAVDAASQALAKLAKGGGGTVRPTRRVGRPDPLQRVLSPGRR